MRTFPRIQLVAVSILLGLPFPAEGDDDVAADLPVTVEKDLFFPPARLAAADGIMDTGPSWGHSGPWIEDVDGDGLQDLVVGDFSGLFRFYRNTGTNWKPCYEKAVNLKADGEEAKVPIS